MPSFAVPKELQERYNIDRRHVYDYFHSRGLRVIKEDKNGNTTVPNYFAPGPVRSVQTFELIIKNMTDM
ncbi:hypothetical protein F4604DRAFT_1591404 [Suillus subluteus]|nr:hypothetical protein F4604DRAFT_1591404 [Suillus subluteus]